MLNYPILVLTIIQLKCFKGAENKHTHNSVRGQESLSGGDEGDKYGGAY